ncbi:MAG TPA: DUF4331 family protein [Kofleriaceae bacterium]|nr:DUF4331 family protein [Kofleriaceae bacterium]
MKKLAFLGGAAGVGIVAILGIHHGQAADHADAPALATQPMADLNDVYTWMTTDGTKVNLALTVSPFDNLAEAANMTRHFGPTVTYAFHITSRPGFQMAGTESKIICKFADDTHGECWVTDSANKVVDYVTGDLSGANGRISATGKFRVFAGRRSDPFFFNLGGVRSAVAAAEGVCAGACPPSTVGATDASGCMKVSKGQGDALRGAIGTKPATDLTSTPCDDTANIDCFIDANVMAIVIQIDKDELLHDTDKLLSVWASTHTGS